MPQQRICMVQKIQKQYAYGSVMDKAEKVTSAACICVKSSGPMLKSELCCHMCCVPTQVQGRACAALVSMLQNNMLKSVAPAGSLWLGPVHQACQQAHCRGRGTQWRPEKLQQAPRDRLLTGCSGPDVFGLKERRAGWAAQAGQRHQQGALLTISRPVRPFPW